MLLREPPLPFKELCSVLGTGRAIPSYPTSAQVTSESTGGGGSPKLGRILLHGCRQCLVLIHAEPPPPSQLSSGSAQPQGTTSLSSASAIPGARQSLLLSSHTWAPPSHTPIGAAFQREALRSASAKGRGDLMRQQTAREALPASQAQLFPPSLAAGV